VAAVVVAAAEAETAATKPEAQQPRSM